MDSDVTFLLIGSLSNDDNDDDVSEKVAKKMKLLSNLIESISITFNLSNVGDFS